MDEIDIGNEQAERILEVERTQRKPVLPHTGTCHNCFEPIVGNELFCPSAPGEEGCRDDWQRREDAKRRNGRSY